MKKARFSVKTGISCLVSALALLCFVLPFRVNAAMSTYQVTLKTGDVRYAGTDMDVIFNVTGVNGTSRTGVVLDEPIVNDRERGDVNNYTVELGRTYIDENDDEIDDGDLGALTNFTLQLKKAVWPWSDDWFLASVIVNGKEYFINHWVVDGGCVYVNVKDQTYKVCDEDDNKQFEGSTVSASAVPASETASSFSDASIRFIAAGITVMIIAAAAATVIVRRKKKAAAEKSGR